MSRNKETILGVIAIVAVGMLVILAMQLGQSKQGAVAVESASVQVEYDGDWYGYISINGNRTTVTGAGFHIFPISLDNDLINLEAEFSKIGGAGTLKLSILNEDGDTIKTAATTSGLPSAHVEVALVPL